MTDSILQTSITNNAFLGTVSKMMQYHLHVSLHNERFIEEGAQTLDQISTFLNEHIDVRYIVLVKEHKRVGAGFVLCYLDTSMVFQAKDVVFTEDFIFNVCGTLIAGATLRDLYIKLRAAD